MANDRLSEIIAIANSSQSEQQNILGDQGLFYDPNATVGPITAESSPGKTHLGEVNLFN